MGGTQANIDSTVAASMGSLQRFEIAWSSKPTPRARHPHGVQRSTGRQRAGAEFRRPRREVSSADTFTEAS